MVGALLGRSRETRCFGRNLNRPSNYRINRIKLTIEGTKVPNNVVETEISIIPLAFVENGRCESVRFLEGETSRRKPRFIENFENGNAEAREETEGEKEDVERDAAKPRGPCKVRKGE